jgi:hypothetical protein
MSSSYLTSKNTLNWKEIDILFGNLPGKWIIVTAVMNMCVYVHMQVWSREAKFSLCESSYGI